MASQPSNDPRTLANMEQCSLSITSPSAPLAQDQLFAQTKTLRDASIEVPSPETPIAMIHTGDLLQPANTHVLNGSQSAYMELSARSIGSSLFYKMLPLEMREEVYKYLLTNPILGSEFAIDPALGYGRKAKYNLSPAILRTSRAIHEEAEHILYGKNAFIISLLGNDRRSQSSKPWSMGIPCPLMRYLPRGDLALTTGVSKVKRWTVMASCWAGNVGRTYPPVVIPGFCREVSGVPLESITFLLLDHDACRQSRSHALKHDVNRSCPLVISKTSIPFDLGKVLSPFRLLHSLRSVNIDLTGRNADEKKVLVELKTLLMSEAEVDRVFRMYANLLRYARAFERCKKFKDDMGTPFGLFREKELAKTRNETINWYPSKAEREKKGLSGSLRTLNPFKLYNPHPVERALELAKFALDDNDADEFKKQRNIALEYLEPHYQRILSFDPTVLSFLDEHRPKWGDKFPLQNANLRGVMLGGTDLVKKYARTFVRQLTGESKVIAELHKDVFDGFYKDSSRECYIKEAGKLATTSSWRCWRAEFQGAIMSMDKQYMEIQAARKELFRNDRAGTDVGCKIDVSYVGREKNLDWTP